MLSVNIDVNDIESVVSPWVDKLSNCREKCKKLQEKRKCLTERKDFIKQRVGPSVTLTEYFKGKPELNRSDNREIFQLVYDIHNLELKSLELNEKLRIVEIEKEVKEIIKSFQPVDESSYLSVWYRELKCCKQGTQLYYHHEWQCIVQNVNETEFMVCVCEADLSVDYVNFIKDKLILKFTVLYKGVAVMIFIQEIRSEESIPSSYKVKSDIFIENLSEKTCEFLQENLSIDKLLKFIQGGMEEEILPYATSYITPED